MKLNRWLVREGRPPRKPATLTLMFYVSTEQLVNEEYVKMLLMEAADAAALAIMDSRDVRACKLVDAYVAKGDSVIWGLESGKGAGAC